MASRLSTRNLGGFLLHQNVLLAYLSILSTDTKSSIQNSLILRSLEPRPFSMTLRGSTQCALTINDIAEPAARRPLGLALLDR